MSELTKILHVEDEGDIREIANMALELIGGFTVAQAELGTVALDIVGDFAPDLLLCDVQMPGLTGPETLAEIRKMPGYENIPAVFLTARLTDGCAGIRNHPMDLDIIGKPFDPTTLAEQVRAIWNENLDAAA